jgi:hypothetical protein
VQNFTLNSLITKAKEKTNRKLMGKRERGREREKKKKRGAIFFNQILVRVIWYKNV